MCRLEWAPRSPRTTLVKELAESAERSVANAQHRYLSPCPNPQMAIVHQESGRLLFQFDREIFSGLMKDFEIFQQQLASNRGSLIFFDLPVNNQRGLTGKLICFREEIGIIR